MKLAIPPVVYERPEVAGPPHEPVVFCGAKLGKYKKRGRGSNIKEAKQELVNWNGPRPETRLTEIGLAY